MNSKSYYMMDFIIPVIDLSTEILQGVNLVDNETCDKFFASLSKFINIHDGLLDQFKKITFQHQFLNEDSPHSDVESELKK